MVVSRSTTQTARNINDLLEERDILGLLTIAAGSAGGVILTQRIANRVLPLAGLNPTPESITEGAASAGLKSVIGAAFMYAATQTDGVGKVLLAFLSLGSLTSAGFDIVQLFIEVPSLAQPNTTSASSRSRSRNVKARVKSSSKSPSASSSSGSRRATAVGGNNF